MLRWVFSILNHCSRMFYTYLKRAGLAPERSRKRPEDVCHSSTQLLCAQPTCSQTRSLERRSPQPTDRRTPAPRHGTEQPARAVCRVCEHVHTCAGRRAGGHEGTPRAACVQPGPCTPSSGGGPFGQVPCCCRSELLGDGWRPQPFRPPASHTVALVVWRWSGCHT